MNPVNFLDEQLKLIDAGSYDPLSEAFDRFTIDCSTPLALQLLALAGVQPAQRLLDVGTGTGLVALHAVSQVGRDGAVLGIDLSEGMLQVARAKATAAIPGVVQFRRMDAEALELEDHSFDSVVSLFALFHFPNPLRALQEMYRVLRPQGRIVIGVGSGAPWLSWHGLVHRFRCLPGLWLGLRGRRLTAPDFLNGLVEKYFPSFARTEVPAWVATTLHKRGKVQALMRAAGFTQLRTCWKGHQVDLQDPVAFWDLQVTFSSLARKRLTRVPREKVAALRNEFLQTCAKVQARRGKLAYPCGAFYVQGVKE